MAIDVFREEHNEDFTSGYIKALYDIKRRFELVEKSRENIEQLLKEINEIVNRL